jgi:hypothetical protein
LPVDCDEVLISEAGEQSKYAALIPPGYSWRFSNGYGRLSDSTGLFTRAFVVTLPGASTLLLKSQLRRLAASCFSQATSDASGHSYPPLQDALDAMSLAVIGLKPKTLAQFFPVAFESQTGDLGQTVQLLALTTNQPAAVDSGTPYVIEGAERALLRGLIERHEIPAPPEDVWMSASLDSDLVDPKQPQNTPYRLVTQCLPHGPSSFPRERTYAAAWVRAQKPATIFGTELARLQAASSANQQAFLVPQLYMGVIPAANGITVSFAGNVATEQTTNASSSKYDYKVELLPNTAEHGAGTVDFDGFAVPAVGPGQQLGTPSVEVLLSLRAVTSFGSMRRALVEKLLSAWRWKQILDSANGRLTEPRALALAQTLMRFNEPLWQYLVLQSVLSTAKTYSLCDDLGFGLLEARLRSWATVARNPASAFRKAEDKPCGQDGCDVYVAADPRDEEMNSLLFSAVEQDFAGFSLSKTVGRYLSAANPTPPSTAALTGFAERLATVLGQGFTRQSRSYPLLGTPPLRGAVSGVADATLQPDLVWLARAVHKDSGGNAWTQPLAVFADTRVDLALQALVNAAQTTQQLQWIEWQDPAGSSSSTNTLAPEPPTLTPTVYITLDDVNSKAVLAEIGKPARPVVQSKYREYLTHPTASGPRTPLTTGQCWSQLTNVFTGLSPTTDTTDGRLALMAAYTRSLETHTQWLAKNLPAGPTAPGVFPVHKVQWSASGEPLRPPLTSKTYDQRTYYLIGGLLIAAEMEEVLGPLRIADVDKRRGQGPSLRRTYLEGARRLFTSREKLLEAAWKRLLVGDGLAPGANPPDLVSAATAKFISELSQFQLVAGVVGKTNAGPLPTDK